MNKREGPCSKRGLRGRQSRNKEVEAGVLLLCLFSMKKNKGGSWYRKCWGQERMIREGVWDKGTLRSSKKSDK